MKNKTKKINLILNILMYVFLGCSLILLVVTISLKKNTNEAITLFGYQTRLVVSESMEKCESTYDSISKYKIKDIPLGSLLLIKTVPKEKEEFYKDIKIGDVLTFKYIIGTKQETITHRVVNIDKSDNLIIELRGDNETSNHQTNITSQFVNVYEENSPNFIIGKVVGKSYLLGILLYSLKQPIGMALIIIVPSIIIMIVEITKIINYIYSQKKKKTEDELFNHKKELEELKQKLKSLENEGGKCV